VAARCRDLEAQPGSGWYAVMTSCGGTETLGAAFLIEEGRFYEEFI